VLPRKDSPEALLSAESLKPTYTQASLIQGFLAFAVALGAVFAIGGWMLDLVISSEHFKNADSFSEMERRMQEAPPTYLPGWVRFTIGAVIGGACSTYFWLRGYKLEKVHLQKARKRQQKLRAQLADPNSDAAKALARIPMKPE